ncbi:MAG: hypothetical protein K0B81_05855, partial [Candidatus Cloacimonetes bacterium]|nr:hypothetical protein [Candidatus Cloacimonadota bacterium]
WFSASAAKAIMIMATAAFPAENDIVLREDRYYSLINSTTNYDSDYIQSRKVSLRTIDITGEVITQTQIAVMVYNWGMLRSIHTTETDDHGELELVIGRGSVFISATKDTLFALQEIPAQQEDYQTEIVLSYEQDVSVKTALHYPDPKLPTREQREEWSKYLKGFEEYYNNIVAEYQSLVFPYEQADSLLLDVWTKYRNNKDNFLLFYEDNYPLSSHFLVLLTKIDEKFLWQADHDQLQKLYNAYLDMRHLDYADEIMVNLLSPTVMFEELPKTEMKESMIKWKEGDIDQRIVDIVDHINDNYVVDSELAIQSLIPYDLAMNLTYLTTYQYKMLICSVLRANYIPASYNRIPDIVNIFYHGQWRYYNLRDNSFHSSTREENAEEFAKLTILTVDENNYPLSINEEQYTVTFLQNGLFFPYEDQPEVNPDGNLSVILKPGVYQLQIGYRINNDLTRLYISTIKAEVATEIEKIFVLENYPQKWERFSEELAELTEYLDSKRDVDNKPYYFVLGDYDREPVRRTVDKLNRLVEDTEIVWLGSKIAPDTPNYYQFSEEYLSWLFEHPTLKERVLTIYYNNEEVTWSYFNGFWDTLPE